MADLKQDRSDWLSILGVACVALALYLPALFVRDFWIYHEGRRALIAFEMLQRGEWLAPSLMGETILTKPPLFYWLEMLAFGASGQVAEWSARLPSALAGLLGVAALAGLLRPLLGRSAAVLAGLALAVCPVYLWMAQNAESEMVFVAAGIAAMFCFGRLILKGKPDWGWEAGFYGALAVAFLTKGPLVPLIVLLTVGGWLLLNRQARPLFHLPWPLGLLLIVLPMLAWIGLLWAYDYPVGKIFSELGRHTTPDSPKGEPIYYYLERLNALLFPWPLPLAAAGGLGLRACWRSGGGNRQGAWRKLKEYLYAGTGERLLLMLWFGVALLVISLVPSKKYYYGLCLTPAGAALCGLIYRDWLALPSARLAAFVMRRIKVVGGGLAGLGLVLLVCAFLRHWPRDLPPYSGQTAPNAKILLGWASLWCLGTLAGVAWLGRTQRLKRLGHYGMTWTTISLIGLAVFTTYKLHPQLNNSRSIKKAALEIQAKVPAGSPLFTVEDNHGIWFYLRRPDVPVLMNAEQIREFAARNPGAVGVVTRKKENRVKEAGQYTVLYRANYINPKRDQVLLFRLDVGEAKQLNPPQKRRRPELTQSKGDLPAGGEG